MKSNIVLFKTHRVYIGKLLKSFSLIRICLEDNDVEYKYKIVNYNESFVNFGTGTSGGHGANPGSSSVNVGSNSVKMYEIYVARNDKEKAERLVASCCDVQNMNSGAQNRIVAHRIE